MEVGWQLKAEDMWSMGVFILGKALLSANFGLSSLHQ